MAGHAQLNVCLDGMLEDTNSLDGALIISCYIMIAVQLNIVLHNDRSAIKQVSEFIFHMMERRNNPKL